MASSPPDRFAGRDRFRPGDWELTCWLETPDRPLPPGTAPEVQRDRVRLSPQDADRPPLHVFFGSFYQGAQGIAVQFAQGKVDGALHQPHVAPIREHAVRVGGRYDPVSVRVTMDYQAFGITVRQVVEGRLLEQG